MGLTHMQIKELLDEGRQHECDGVGTEHVCVRIAAIAELPSRFGQFHIVAFYNNKDNKEHVAIVHGDVTGCGGCSGARPLGMPDRGCDRLAAL